MSRLATPGLVMLALFGGCSEPDSAAPTAAAAPYTKPPSTQRVEEPPPALRYVDVTAAAGIDFVHDSGAFGGKLLPETMGSGCAFLDYDDDGDPDLLLLNGDSWPGHEREGGRPTPRLYRNDGGFRFTDVTTEAGLATPFYAMGVAVCDTDADGDPDLFLTGVGGYRFLRNDGGRFVAVDATETGLDPGTWTDAKGGEHGPFAMSAAFTDFDLDGRPDLFVCHYVNWSVATDVWSTMDGKTKSYAIPTQYSGESCRLWRNLGGNRFEDVTDAAGVRNDEGKSLGVCVVDLDDDGDPDLAVANDTQPDYLYRNNGDGTFTEVGLKMGIAYGPDGKVRAGMGMDSCVSPEGGVVLAVGNFSREPVSLWEQRGKTFVNRSDRAGVALATLHPLTFAVRFVDADLDGREDLLLVNGHIEPTIGNVEKDVSYAQPMQLLRSVGDGRFVDVSEHLGPDFGRPIVGRGLALADVDGDGDLDVCVTTNGGAARLLRCDLENAAARSLRVRVRGAAPGPDAFGTRITITVGGSEQVRWLRSGGSYLSQSETTVTFGLGDAGKADRVVVRWPDGTEREYTDVSAGVLVAER